MNRIDSQQELDRFISILDWPHAFLRECYLLSPSYVCAEDRGLIAPDGALTMKMLICTTDVDHPGVELIFSEVEDVCMPCNCDLSPVGEYDKYFVLLSLSGDLERSIRCKQMYYRILGKECWGWNTRYGIENFYEDSGLINNQLL